MATKKETTKVTKEKVQKATKAVAEVVEEKVEKLADIVEDKAEKVYESRDLFFGEKIPLFDSF